MLHNCDYVELCNCAYASFFYLRFFSILLSFICSISFAHSSFRLLIIVRFFVVSFSFWGQHKKRISSSVVQHVETPIKKIYNNRTNEHKNEKESHNNQNWMWNAISGCGKVKLKVRNRPYDTQKRLHLIRFNIVIILYTTLYDEYIPSFGGLEHGGA